MNEAPDTAATEAPAIDSDNSAAAGPYRPVSGWSGPAAIAVTFGIIAASIGGASAVLGLTGQAVPRADGTAIMLLMGASQVIMIVLTLLAARRGATRLRDAFAMRPPANGMSDYALGMALIIGTLVAVNLVAVAILGHDPLADLKQFAGVFKGDAWVFALLIVAVGAPLSEEFLFRGYLQAALTKSSLGFWGGAAVSVILWTALHAGYTVIGMIEVVLIGIVFSYLLKRSGSLRVSLACHALYNGALALYTRFIMS